MADATFTPKLLTIPRKSSCVYQLKVALRNSKPKIWRRIQMPQDSSFLDLHSVIQKIMMWENRHPHSFRGIGLYRNFYGGGGFRNREPEKEYFEMCRKESLSKIGNYFSKMEEKFTYTYDFRLNWIHDIELEEVKIGNPNVMYPICLDGENAGPPENCIDPPDKWPYDFKAFDPKTALDRIVFLY